ncbi:hypothetical protein GS429_07950 [Natronorubrum sp. JWXQ-INN-674]|uniref:Uncharacterized protein n=1 Tax=Natronorubrum halalkaliphilum TaxID=2691917 RepID=A0A6B0VJI0_9EURY|nr:HTH domain-containing protein [Natronorubrum halalkaliphilum]MXV61991.1 hypothetical protein [Natronorubrum halalkaliphilum]
MSEHTTTPKTVELWIRSFAPASAGPTQERALERLDDLESNAQIESVEVGVWGKEVERTDRTTRIPQLQRIETRLEAFESWAARTGRRLEPFFRNTHIESSITGECHDVWRLPTVALAEFDENDDLLHVAPCHHGEGTTDVSDRIDALVGDSEETTFTVDEEDQPDDVADRPSNRMTNFSRVSIEPSPSRSD